MNPQTELEILYTTLDQLRVEYTTSITEGIIFVTIYNTTGSGNITFEFSETYKTLSYLTINGE